MATVAFAKPHIFLTAGQTSFVSPPFSSATSCNISCEECSCFVNLQSVIVCDLELLVCTSGVKFESEMLRFSFGVYNRLAAAKTAL